VESGPPSMPMGKRITEVLLSRGFGADTPPWARLAAIVSMLAGAGLVVTTAVIHLHLWLSGYRHVPKLDVLFLAQAIVGFLLGPIIAGGRQLILLIAGALFMASSAGGLVLSATVGFVGIHDGLDVPWATPSLVVELAGFLLFVLASSIALRPLLRSR
jgi:hypothetical protein